MTERRELRPVQEPTISPAQADPRKEDHEDSSAEPGLTVVTPEYPPLLSPLAAEALLRLIQHVAARQGTEIQADERRAA